MNEANLHRLLLEAKHEDDGDIMNENELEIPRTSSLRKRVSAMVRGLHENITLPIPANNPSFASTAPSKQSSTFQKFTNQQMHQLPLQLNDQSSGSAAFYAGSNILPKVQTPLRTKRSKSAHEENFTKFQQDILDREWLPISTAFQGKSQ